MASGNGPWHNDTHGRSSSNILDHLGSYWLYLFVALLFLIGLGLVGILGFWYVQQKAAVSVPATSTVAGSPRIVVEPTSAPPGAPLQVSGNGWPVGDVVFLSLEAPSSQDRSDFAYAGALVDKTGQFDVSFVFPEETRWANAGAIKVVAWAEQSGAKAVTIFQVAPPTPVVQVDSSGYRTPEALQQGTMQAPASSAGDSVPSSTPTTTLIPAENWYGEYFGNTTLSDSPVFLRNDEEIRFDWGKAGPGNNIGPDAFSVRWTRFVPFTAGVYRFFIQADDGARLWIDDRLKIDQWHAGSPTTYVADTYLWEGPHLLRLEYYEETDEAAVKLWWERLEIFPDWKAEYFDNTELAGQPLVVRNDEQIHFNWENRPPVQGIRSGAFSVRWAQRIRFPRGRYRFYVNSNTGMRVWFDSNLVIDFWNNTGTGLQTTDISLDEGEYSIRVEYYNEGGNARAEFRWEELAQLPTALAPTVQAPMAAAPAGSSVQALSLPETIPVSDPVPPEETRTVLSVPLPNQVSAYSVVVTNTPGVEEMGSVTPLAGEPLVRVDPPQTSPGGEVGVYGTGWTPGEEVIISLVEPGKDMTEAPPFATAVIDSQGQFEQRLLIPYETAWQNLSELILVAHSTDWTTRRVTPLGITPSTALDDLKPISQP